MGNCGCVYCTGRPDSAKGKPVDPSDASHMDIWRRLAAIKIMHGTPGPPKPRKSG